MWNINTNSADIKSPIPLDFDLAMRTEGGLVNIEYKKFLAYRIYEIIPEFINISDTTNRFHFHLYTDSNNTLLHLAFTVIL